MGKRKSKNTQRKKITENISRSHVLQEKPNENMKPGEVSVPDDSSERLDLGKESDNVQHGEYFTANPCDCSLELSTEDSHEILKDEGDCKIIMFQKNNFSELKSVDKQVEQGNQHDRNQNTNSHKNSNSCDFQPEGQCQLINSSENNKKFITEENFEQTFEHTISENNMHEDANYENENGNFLLGSKSVVRYCEDNVSVNMNAYTKSKTNFSTIYSKWLEERKKTLEKLRSLLNELHNAQIIFNKTQAVLRSMSYSSRVAKCNQQSQIIDFVASVGAFLSDASRGVTSVVQAYSIDHYQSQFKEIMDHDAEITKDLYNARSQFMVKYQGIEEVIRTFHAVTLDSTVGKISEALKVDKFLLAFDKAYESGDMSKMRNIVCKFTHNALESEVFEKIADSVKSYITENHAALEAYKSAARATYEIFDIYCKNRNDVMDNARMSANHILMFEDKIQLDRLKSSIDEDLPQSKLESHIEDAIDFLQSEMEEVKDMYCELF